MTRSNHVSDDDIENPVIPGTVTVLSHIGRVYTGSYVEPNGESLTYCTRGAGIGMGYR